MKTLVKTDLFEIKTLDNTDAKLLGSPPGSDLAQIEITTPRMTVEIFVDARKKTEETERNHCDQVIIQNRLPCLLSGESLGHFKIKGAGGYGTVSIRAIDIKKDKRNWTCTRCDTINQFDIGYCVQCRTRKQKKSIQCPKYIEETSKKMDAKGL
jgi:hypothetical protein